MKRNRTKGKPNNKAVKSIPTQLGLQTLQNDGRVEVRIMSQFFPAQVVSSAIATVFGALYFRVSDMAGNGDMVAAFDQFKIAEVDVTFIPNQDKVTASADSGSIAVQHFGLKYAWTVTTTAQTMDMFVRMKVLWRGRRLT